MLIVMPYQVGPRTARLLRGQASRSVVWFREVPGSHAVWCVILRVPFRQVPPLLPSQEWWGHPWHWAPDPSHSATSGVSRVQVVGP
jgi:hypothetical protein